MPSQSKKVAILVPGVANRSAQGAAINAFRPALEAADFHVITWGYGWVLWLTALLTWRLVARDLKAYCLKLARLGWTILILGHSNGGAVATEAAVKGAPCDWLVTIIAAIERDQKRGPHVGKWIHCYLAGDRLLKLAARIPQPAWGDGGTVALEQADVNLDLAEYGAADHSLFDEPTVVRALMNELITHLAR